MSFPADRPDLKFEVNFEDDPLQAHPVYLESTGPIGFWRMEAVSGTTEQDQTANNRDLTYINSPSLGQVGAYLVGYGDLNTSVFLNGTSQYAETAASSTWQNLYAAWSISVWIYPTAARATSVNWCSVVAHQWLGSGTIPFYINYGANAFLGMGDSKVAVGHTIGGSDFVAFDPTSPTLNTWTHYVGTFDGTQFVLYRNGASVGTGTPGAEAAAVSTAKLYVGVYDRGGVANPYFPGLVDEVAVWDRVLSSVEAANLYRYLTVTPVDDGNYIDLSASVDLSSARVRSAPIRRGRSDSVSRVEAGTGTLVLGNRDGTLSPDPVVNLIVNPSLEIDEAGLPFAVQGGNRLRSADGVTGGSYSGVAIATAGSGAFMYVTTERTGLVGMRPGKTYTFSAYVFLNSLFGPPPLADVWLEIVDEVAGSQQVTAGTNFSAAGGGYDAATRLTVTRTIRADADAAYARIVLQDADVAKAVYYDHVQLEEGSSATAYCDGDQTDCSWGGEPHRSLSHRKQASAPARKIGMPMRRFRLTANWDGTDYGLLHGYVERWDWTFPSQGKDAYVTCRLADGTRILANFSMRGFSRSSERVGDRVRAILAYAGIGEDDYDVDDSFINTIALRAQATVADDSSALSLIRAIEETERGVFFVNKDGQFTYQGNMYRSIEGVEDLIITDTTDDENQARYSDISISTDVAGLVNDENIENVQSGTDYRRVYSLSEQRYFPVSGSESSLWQTDTVSYLDRSFPLPFAEGIEIRPYRDPDSLWPAILGIELGALVRVERTHQGVDLAAGELHFLEGLEHDISPGNWVTRLRTAPTPRAPISADPWQTPVAKPIYLTNVFSGSGGSSVVIPSRLWTTGKLYLLFCSLHATGGTAPVAPSFTATNTFTNIRADTGVSSVSWRHATYRCLATSTVTEAVTLSFAGQTPNNLYDVVLIEVSSGFHPTTPVQDNAASTTVSAFAGYVDVGTLTDAESIILAGVWKNANADTNWSGGVELYDRASFNNAYSVAYGYPPGIDRIDFSSGSSGGFHGTGFEVQAS